MTSKRRPSASPTSGMALAPTHLSAPLAYTNWPPIYWRYPTSLDASSPDTAHVDAFQSIVDQDDRPLDIHDICRQRRACGFTDDLALTDWEAQAINTRLYGLSAISALLMGADDGRS